MQHLSKIPEYPPISNPSRQQGLVSNSLYVTSTLSQVTIPKYVLNFFLWGPSVFSVTGSTWTRGLSTPTGLVTNDLRHVTFLVRFKVEGECDAASVGGGGGELGGVVIFR